MSNMKVRIERIGPRMAQIYSKEFEPRRVRLVPSNCLPPDSKIGDEVTVEREFLAGFDKVN